MRLQLLLALSSCLLLSTCMEPPSARGEVAPVPATPLVYADTRPEPRVGDRVGDAYLVNRALVEDYAGLLLSLGTYPWVHPGDGVTVGEDDRGRITYSLDLQHYHLYLELVRDAHVARPSLPRGDLSP